MLQKPLNRRQMLKAILAAGGGITAASFLPAKWLKPVVESGVLPAHAATSCSLYDYALHFNWDQNTIFGLNVDVTPDPGDGTTVHYQLIAAGGGIHITGSVGITGVGTTTAGNATFPGNYTYSGNVILGTSFMTIHWIIGNCGTTKTYYFKK